MGVKVERAAKPDYEAIAAEGGIAKATARNRSQRPQEARKAVNKENRPRVAVNDKVRKGPHWHACHAMNCACCGAAAPSEAHHEPPVSRGGEDADCIPLCTPCHVRRHAIGEHSFWEQEGHDPGDLKLGVEAWVESGRPATPICAPAHPSAGPLGRSPAPTVSARPCIT